MAGEIIGEIIMFGVEMGLESAGSGDGKDKSGCGLGCVVALIFIIGGIIALYYTCKT